MKMRRIPASAQQGLSLLELMIAMTIGMILAVVIAQAYLSSKQVQQGQSDLSRMNEAARFSFDLLSRSGRMTGYRDNVSGAYGSAFLSFPTSESTAVEFLAGSNDTTTITVGGSSITTLNRSDSISFSFFGSDNVAGTAADNTVFNCTGTSVRRATRVTDTIYVAADSANGNEPTLYCASTNSAVAGVTITPLIPGVESFQVLYGQDTDTDGVVNRLVSASSLTSATVGSVKSLLVSLVVRSESGTNVTSESKTFNHFGPSYAGSGDAGHAFVSPTDARLRKLYTATIAMRNNL